MPSQPVTKLFIGNGTNLVSVPMDVTSLTAAYVVGGGGAGGYRATTNGLGGGGGGGGLAGVLAVPWGLPATNSSSYLQVVSGANGLGGATPTAAGQSYIATGFSAFSIGAVTGNGTNITFNYSGLLTPFVMQAGVMFIPAGLTAPFTGLNGTIFTVASATPTNSTSGSFTIANATSGNGTGSTAQWVTALGMPGGNAPADTTGTVTTAGTAGGAGTDPNASTQYATNGGAGGVGGTTAQVANASGAGGGAGGTSSAGGAGAGGAVANAGGAGGTRDAHSTNILSENSVAMPGNGAAGVAASNTAGSGGSYGSGGSGARRSSAGTLTGGSGGAGIGYVSFTTSDPLVVNQVTFSFASGGTSRFFDGLTANQYPVRVGSLLVAFITIPTTGTITAATINGVAGTRVAGASTTNATTTMETWTWPNFAGGSATFSYTTSDGSTANITLVEVINAGTVGAGLATFSNSAGTTATCPVTSYTPHQLMLAAFNRTMTAQVSANSGGFVFSSASVPAVAQGPRFTSGSSACAITQASATWIAVSLVISPETTFPATPYIRQQSDRWVNNMQLQSTPLAGNAVVALIAVGTALGTGVGGVASATLGGVAGIPVPGGSVGYVAGVTEDLEAWYWPNVTPGSNGYSANTQDITWTLSSGTSTYSTVFEIVNAGAIKGQGEYATTTNGSAVSLTPAYVQPGTLVFAQAAEEYVYASFTIPTGTANWSAAGLSGVTYLSYAWMVRTATSTAAISTGSFTPFEAQLSTVMAFYVYPQTLPPPAVLPKYRPLPPRFRNVIDAVPVSSVTAPPGTGVGTYSYSALATGVVNVAGTAVEPMTYTALAVGSIVALGSETVTYTALATGTSTTPATASESITYGSLATGTLGGSGTEPMTYSALATGAVTVAGTTSETVMYTASAQGTLAGTASETMTYSALAMGSQVFTASASGTITYSALASGTYTTGGVGSGNETITFTALATGTIGVAGTATEPITFTALATGSIAATATEAMAYSAQAVATLADTGAFTATYSALATGTVKVAASGSITIGFGSLGSGSPAGAKPGAGSALVSYSALAQATINFPASGTISIGYTASANIGAPVIQGVATGFLTASVVEMELLACTADGYMTASMVAAVLTASETMAINSAAPPETTLT